MVFIKKPFDFHFPFADAMCFIPMQFSQSNLARSIGAGDYTEMLAILFIGARSLRSAPQ